MKRSPLFLAAVALALAFLAAGASAQKAEAPTKPDIVGTWTGYAVAPEQRFELTAVFAKTEAGYTGKLSDASGMLADIPLREIVFKDGKLNFEFDLNMGMDTQVIKIEMTLEKDVLKGAWFDAEGNTDVVELNRQK